MMFPRYFLSLNLHNSPISDAQFSPYVGECPSLHRPLLNIALLHHGIVPHPLYIAPYHLVIVPHLQDTTLHHQDIVLLLLHIVQALPCPLPLKKEAIPSLEKSTQPQLSKFIQNQAIDMQT